MSKALYIIGTDTDVGKTVITGAIAAYLKKSGRDVGVYKPFQCAGNDAAILQQLAQSQDEPKEINPYYFEEALAPAVAAERAQSHIDFVKVVETFRTLQTRHEILISEGAGGLLVPLIGNKTHIELLKELRVPVLVVGRLGLGTINHTLLTLEVLKHNHIPCYGVILNELSPQNSVAEATNPQVLTDYYQVPLLGVFPYCPPPHEATKLCTSLPKELSNFLDKC